MASNQQHVQKQEQQNSQNPRMQIERDQYSTTVLTISFVFHFLAPGFGTESWMTNPFDLAPPVNGTPVIDDVGNVQQSSYQEQTYTLPGTTSYYESSG